MIRLPISIADLSGQKKQEGTSAAAACRAMSSDNTSCPSPALLPIMESFPSASPLTRWSYPTYPVGTYRPRPRTLERTSVKSIARDITSWTVEAPFRVPIFSCFIATMTSPFVSIRVFSVFSCSLSGMHFIFYIRYLGHEVSDSTYPGPARIPTRRVSRQQRIVAL